MPDGMSHALDSGVDFMAPISGTNSWSICRWLLWKLIHSADMHLSAWVCKVVWYRILWYHAMLCSIMRTYALQTCTVYMLCEWVLKLLLLRSLLYCGHNNILQTWELQFSLLLYHILSLSFLITQSSSKRHLMSTVSSSLDKWTVVIIIPNSTILLR